MGAPIIISIATYCLQFRSNKLCWHVIASFISKLTIFCYLFAAIFIVIAELCCVLQGGSQAVCTKLVEDYITPSRLKLSSPVTHIDQVKLFDQLFCHVIINIVFSFSHEDLYLM